MKLRFFPGVLAVIIVLARMAGATPLVVTVDVTQERRAISPLIYGINYAGQSSYEDTLKQPQEVSSAVVSDLNAALVRNGGNLGSRYNWQQNSMNHASDFYYESIAGDGQAVDNQRDSDVFVRIARNGGAEPSVTIPMIDWLSKLGANNSILYSFSITKYGAQDDNDQFLPDAGDGLQNGIPIVTNNKTDASTQNSVAFEQGFVDYLQTHPSGDPALKYFTMDNEPDLWSNTHADVVHPDGGYTNGQFDPTNEGDTSTQYALRLAQFATMVKQQAPAGLILAPETSSYFGYLVSPYDRQYANNLAANNDPNAYSSYPNDGDMAGHYRTATTANPDGEYMPWLLGQLKAEQGNGPRLLDYCTVHYYPDDVSLNLGVSPALQTERSQSTRMLWDPTYNGTADGVTVALQLIPRMHGWINANYPGTKTGITEYNWGAENHINGATTLADVLGIFGREGLDLATAFPYPPAPIANNLAHSGFTYSAFKMYRNYDGHKSTFGDTHVKLSPTPNANSFGFYAAQRTSDKKLTVMLINKGTTAQDVQVNLAGFTAGTTPQLYRITSATSAIQSLPASDATLTASRLSLNLPAQSVTLAIVPPPSSASPGLGNISTRLSVQTGNNVLIGGFIVTGTQNKKVILRALGPSLPVSGKLANPILELHNSKGSVIFSNDNWQDTQAAEIRATGIAPTNPLESAIVATLPANNSAYTAIVRGVNGGTGVGLVEVYDLDQSADSKLANISTRGLVQTGNNVMIGGFIVLGGHAQKLIVRALGPSLPVAGALQDPTLELHNSNGTTLATNDNWKINDQTGQSQAAAVEATGVPPTKDAESALVETLSPGNYTAIVRGKNNTTGIGLVEVYTLP